ncbi:hypothetical protein M758_3G260700 [Ceratodon purpureus]|nr:hypothetical protein M758_3G260700 [Ceratodon purpureus]
MGRLQSFINVSSWTFFLCFSGLVIFAIYATGDVMMTEATVLFFTTYKFSNVFQCLMNRPQNRSCQ